MASRHKNKCLINIYIKGLGMTLIDFGRQVGCVFGGLIGFVSTFL